MLKRYKHIREQTTKLCAPLEIEDYVIQSMVLVSPPKWHLAHTAWFFERFLLEPRTGMKNEEHSFLFNSYYEAVGDRVERDKRGLMSRPTVSDIYLYRQAIDEAVVDLAGDLNESETQTLELGLHHEQQHQELLLTDIKHILWSNPLRPAYGPSPLSAVKTKQRRAEWVEIEGGLHYIGAREAAAFVYDNEKPRHLVHLLPFKIASCAVLNGEFIEFIEAGGYSSAQYWLADGWALVKTQNLIAPLYWEKSASSWMTMTFAGMQSVNQSEPVCHLSYYEADAYARWKGARLPTEAEWEISSAHFTHGDVWEWTASAYLPYPGYQAFQGAFAEYNGKFMCNQMVLRGGSRATPSGHIRPSYRNFFSPETRWQFSGLRLAKDVS